MNVIDKPVNMRSGEELDLKTIDAFLKDSIPGLEGRLSITQFPSGYSNLTYLIRIGDIEMVLRRPPFGRKAKSAHDMEREFRILTALHPHFPYSPRPIVYNEDNSVMGCPFYVMERIKGIILRKDLPAGLHYTPENARKLCENLLDVHLELHGLDYMEMGLMDFGKPVGYVRRQVEGWSGRYRQARTPDGPDCEHVMQWLREKQPPDSPKTAIVHNDYKFDNVVLSPNNPLEIIGILDWEMATIGDPLLDLGCSLAYWVQADDSPNLQALRLMPTDIPGALTRQELIVRYAQRSGTQIDNFDFYYCFGLFRLAVIAQQIYYRFYHGQTKDERFQSLIYAVYIMEETAREVIEKTDL